MYTGIRQGNVHINCGSIAHQFSTDIYLYIKNQNKISEWNGKISQSVWGVSSTVSIGSPRSAIILKMVDH